LIQNFKQVAVDQISHEKREFQTIPYIESVLTNLEPKLKQTRHRVTVIGNAALKTVSYPSALSLVVTHLAMNSLLHPYQPTEVGQLRFDVMLQGTLDCQSILTERTRFILNLPLTLGDEATHV